MKKTSLCGLGRAAPNPVLSTLEHFRDEYLAHVVEKKCPAHKCTGLIRYEIDAAKCVGCTLCAGTARCRASPASGKSRTRSTSSAASSAASVSTSAASTRCKDYEVGGAAVQSAEYLDSDDEVLTFRTPRWTRIWSIAYSCAVGGFCFPTSFYFALMIYIFADFEGAPLIASVGLALLFLAFATRLTWKLCLAPLRFSLTIGKNVVEAGRGWLRCVFACDEVEMISMPDKRKVHGIALEGGGRGAFVYLSPTAELICAALLRHRCPNAVFVDRWGNEHLPICANQPLLTLTALYKNQSFVGVGELSYVSGHRCN